VHPLGGHFHIENGWTAAWNLFSFGLESVDYGVPRERAWFFRSDFDASGFPVTLRQQIEILSFCPGFLDDAYFETVVSE
jgi:hypothetical protein